MKKAIISSIILLVVTTYTYAQIPVGLLHDANGKPLNGYLDPPSYTPEKKLVIYKFTPNGQGHYFDNDGNKTEGLITPKGNGFLFKAGKDLPVKIKPKNVNAVVMGMDSFIVIKKDTRVGQEKIYKPIFAKHIAEINDYIFTQRYAGSYSYLVKLKEATDWRTFSDYKKKFQQEAIKYFGHVPFLEKGILSGDYKRADVLKLIKIAEYYDKYEKGELIHYNKYWQETKDIEKATYTAKITQQKDSLWTLDYYNDSTKLYQVNYSSIYPQTKNGDFTVYYPNGTTRKIISYRDDKPRVVKIFDKTGALHMQYHYGKRAISYDKYATILAYTTVNDSLGNNILTPNKPSTLKVYDEFSGLTYTNVFDKNERVACYRLMGTDTIFQPTNLSYNFKVGALQKKLNNYISSIDFDEALKDNVQGIMLVSLLINDEGHVIQSNILNELHPEINEAVRDFVTKNLLAATINRHKFKSYKKDKIKRYFEVALPVVFMSERFYVSTDNYNHNWFFDQMIQQQQQDMMRWQQEVINNIPKR